MPRQMTPDQQDENRQRAQAFLARANALAEVGSYDQAIEVCVQGLHLDPDNVDAHQNLRRIALERKAHGGRDIGLTERMKLPTVKQQLGPMLAAEKLLAYAPDDRSRLTDFFKAAEATGAAATAAWARGVLKAGRA